VFDFIQKCCCFTKQNTWVAVNSSCWVICLVGTIVRLPRNTSKSLGMQRSATKSIIVICAIAYLYIIFVQDMITWTSFRVTTTICNAVVINKTQQCYYQYIKVTWYIMYYNIGLNGKTNRAEIKHQFCFTRI
jgi:hypothetical protein